MMKTDTKALLTKRDDYFPFTISMKDITMAVRTYEALVRLNNGQNTAVFVQAVDSSTAKAILESQYGHGAVRGTPLPR
jgi:hypothetical protein